MPVVDGNIRFYKSANHPSNDTSTAGGAIAAGPVEITDATVGEYLPKLLTRASGDIDTDAVTQYQVGYWRNGNGVDSFVAPKVYLGNAIMAHSGTTQLRFVSSSASDNTTKLVRIHGVLSGGVLTIQNVTLNGTTGVVSTNLWTRVFRVTVRLVSTGALSSAAGIITMQEWDGASSLSDLATIPIGYDCATGEFDYALAAANGDVGTFTNRVTEPAGLTWLRQRQEATASALPADLGPGERCAMYCRQILQPGMPTHDIKLDWRIVGEV